MGTPADKVSLSCELVNYKAKGSKDSHKAIGYFEGLSEIDCEATNAKNAKLGNYMKLLSNISNSVTFHKSPFQTRGDGPAVFLPSIRDASPATMGEEHLHSWMSQHFGLRCKGLRRSGRWQFYPWKINP